MPTPTAPPTGPLALRRVGRRYGLRGPWVLRDVDLDVPAGALIRVRGANGSGKSTLLRVMAGIDAPGTGRVLGRPRTAYVPERFPGALPFTALGYLTHLGRIHGLARAEASRRAREQLERFGAAAYADTPLAELSKGSSQKVAVAQALLAAPELLILDEAWTGLDPAARDELDRAVAERTAAGGTVVYVDHDPHRLAGAADAVYEVAEGRVARVAAGEWAGPRRPAGAAEAVCESGGGRVSPASDSTFSGLDPAARGELEGGVAERVAADGAVDHDPRRPAGAAEAVCESGGGRVSPASDSTFSGLDPAVRGALEGVGSGHAGADGAVVRVDDDPRHPGVAEDTVCEVAGGRVAPVPEAGVAGRAAGGGTGHLDHDPRSPSGTADAAWTGLEHVDHDPGGPAGAADAAERCSVVVEATRPGHEPTGLPQPHTLTRLDARTVRVTTPASHSDAVLRALLGARPPWHVVAVRTESPTSTEPR